MSASLVGSEMCIRDSATPARAHPARRSRLRRSCPDSSGRARRCCSPVSYTHLTLPTICSV
eukprot:4896527-Alexandrium_andersonii.AAC.1